MTARRTVALFALLSMGAACTLLNLGDLDDYRGSPAAGIDADAQTDPSDVVDSGFCGRRPPSRPAHVAEDKESVLYFVLDDARWEEEGGTPVNGYDLDGVCGCPPPRACVPWREGPPSCPPDGIDNAGNGTLDLALKYADASVADEIRRGRDNLILGIRYNGLADDDRGTVSLFATAGTVDASPPVFDGGDRYTIDRKWSFSGPFPKNRDDNAYVVARTFVADARQFNLKLGRLDARLFNGVITGTLEQRGGLWHIVDGRIAGAIRTLDLFEYLVRGGSCPGSPDYEGARTFICGATDQRVGGAAPGGNPPKCDAHSIALAFSATELPGFDPAAAPDFARVTLNCGDASTSDCTE